QWSASLPARGGGLLMVAANAQSARLGSISARAARTWQPADGGSARLSATGRRGTLPVRRDRGRIVSADAGRGLDLAVGSLPQGGGLRLFLGRGVGRRGDDALIF